MQEDPSVLGSDIAKPVLHVMGVDTTGKVLVRKRPFGHGNPSFHQHWGGGVHKPRAKCEAMAMPLCTDIGRRRLEREEAVERHL